jgi:hypothetical protein
MHGCEFPSLARSQTAANRAPARFDAGVVAGAKPAD